MKTYVKIYGPPLMKALDELQKIAVKMPKVTHYHFLVGLAGYTGSIFPTSGSIGGPSGVDGGLPWGATSRPEKSTHPLISKSGRTLGEHDFFFEWKDEPTWDEVRDLISKIDEAFTRLGCKYTLTTK
ncbi:MAG: hypothetical protein ABSD41_11210 [Candidatus Bathyarchaeia archaeon]